MGTSMDEIHNFREFLYQYILPQPELDADALQGDRLELENLHAVLAGPRPAPTRWKRCVNFGREAAEKQTQTLVNRGAALLARAAADGGEQTVWQEHLDAGHRQLEQLNARYADAKNTEAEARRAYLSAHGAASASGARGPGTGCPDRGTFPPQNGAGRGCTQSRKGRKRPCPHPEPAGGAAPQRLHPASGPKRCRS